jgi:eukaryotic-like serine/threonine-protein kinase
MVSLAILGGKSVEPAPPPSAIGKYNLIASLGKGGMAEVYLAVVAGPGGFNKLLVVKVLREDTYSGTDDGIRMFWDEARLSAQLVHPNIVHTYEVGEVSGRYFLAMEYLDGQTYRALQIRASSTGALPLQEELRILSETARGLHYAHQLKRFDGAPLGVVHRDVSPQNVFVTYDGQVKLLDFGIAKTHDAGHLTQVGVIKGKLDYIAPEQLRGDPVDARSDVFALGVMLWETLAQKRFAGGRAVAEAKKVHARVMAGEPKVRDVAPHAPEELAQIVDRAIALEARDRYPDAAAFADAIDAYLESAGKRPSAKSLASVLSTMFERERAKIHKLIDQKLSAIQRGEFNGELTLLSEADPRSTSGQYLGELSASSPRSGVHGVEAHTPAPQVIELPSRRRGLGLVLAAAVVAGAGAVALWPRASEPAAPVVVAAAAAPTPVASAPLPGALPAAPSPQAPTYGPSEPLRAPADSVQVAVRVTPASAQVTIDGAALELPFSGEFLRSAALHIVEASADGYRPYRRMIPFSEDRTLEIALERAPQPVVRRQPQGRGGHRADNTPAREPEPQAAPVADAPAPARAAAPGADLTPRTRVAPAKIDVSNPYATTN